MVLPGARKSTLPSGSRRRHLVALSLAMTALLCAISAPRVHAQNPTDQWVEDGGSIVASPMMLTVREGESAAYSVNLTAPPTAEAGNEPWWVFVHVDGQRRADGRYKSIHWVPSIGREFYMSDWSAENGKDIRIHAEDDANELDEVYIFTHDLWDHDAYCPEGLHGEGDVARVVVTVIDDDGPNAPQPELSIGDASVEEGGTARFEVRLDTASERAVTVHYRTSNGTALADSDYERVDDTLLTIPAETRIAIIEVQTKEDDDYEADETFTVRLSSPAGATIGDGDGTGEGTITNDDAAPEVFIENDATVDEGDPAPFVVKLSAQSVLPVRVPVATMDGTAVAGSDYTAIDRTLTFQPGTDSLTVDVSTRDDNADEPETETFTLALSAPDGATLRNNQSTGTGTIRDNDDLPDTGRTTAGCGATKRPGSSNDRNTVTRRETTPDRPPRAGRDPPMTNDQTVPREQIDAEIERIRTVLREYPWYIGRSGRIRATLLEETDDKTEETVCPIAMLSMHASDQQIETVLANPAHRQWAERVEETVPTDVAEHVERIAEENDSAPLTDRNELRRYAAALLINDEPVSAPAAELVGLERETIRRLVDAADDTSTPLESLNKHHLHS